MKKSNLDAIILTAFGTVLFGLSFFVEDPKNIVTLSFGAAMFYLSAFVHYIDPGERDYSEDSEKDDLPICSQCDRACIGTKWEWIGNPCSHGIWCLDCINKHLQDINEKEN